MPRPSLIAVALCAALGPTATPALVVTAPPPATATTATRRTAGSVTPPAAPPASPPRDGSGRDGARPAKGMATKSTSTSTSILVRKTGPDDLDRIADLLADASIASDGVGGGTTAPAAFDWNRSIRRNRARATLRTQLSHRLRAVDAGGRAAARALSALTTAASSLADECLLARYSDLCTLDPDACRILWEDDEFRSMVERAARSSSERTGWDGHNFALAPDDPALLRHAMLTAVDRQVGGGGGEGDVVGFVEVAMLPPLRRAHHYGDDGSGYDAEHIPTIVNLVTCPSRRRRGVASSLLRSASRYVRTHWEGADELGLYVDGSNRVALALYEGGGFDMMAECPDVEGRLYLSRSLAGA